MNTYETNSSTQPEQVPPSSEQPLGQHPYHAPILTDYGPLAELTQANPGVGADGGGGGFPDCTLS